MHLEDDWIIAPRRENLEACIASALGLLERSPYLHSVRFARWENETERINGLSTRHGIDAQCTAINDDFDVSTDLSLNPHITRGRSMYHACMLMSRMSGAKHPEHTLSHAIKVLSHSPLTFAHFNPSLIVARHRGCIPGEEDDPTKPLIAT